MYAGELLFWAFLSSLGSVAHNWFYIRLAEKGAFKWKNKEYRGEEAKGVVGEAILEYYAFQVIGAAESLKWLDFERVFYSASSVLSVSYLRQFKSMNSQRIDTKFDKL